MSKWRENSARDARVNTRFPLVLCFSLGWELGEEQERNSPYANTAIMFHVIGANCHLRTPQDANVTTGNAVCSFWPVLGPGRPVPYEKLDFFPFFACAVLTRLRTSGKMLSFQWFCLLYFYDILCNLYVMYPNTTETGKYAIRIIIASYF